MSLKPKIAFYWCASCGGCEEAVIDLAEDLLPILDAVEIVLWPAAMDFKRRDIEALEDGAITVTFLNGAIRSSEQEEMAQLLRAKSRYLVAYGACAHLGGVPGLANQFSREEILRYAYEDAPTVANPERIRPQPVSWSDGHALTLPVFRRGVRTLDQVVQVDYYVPGCPPPTQLTRAAVELFLAAARNEPGPAGGPSPLPPPGAVLAPDLALCDECPRKASKPETLSFTRFCRPHEIRINPEQCLLAQGIICMGPATRAGCGAACPAGNMPCSGCLGPTSRVRDQGAKMLSALSASAAAKEPEEIAATLAGIPDPVGTFYRYALPASLLRRKWNGTEPASNPAANGRASVLQTPQRATEPASASQTPYVEPIQSPKRAPSS